MKPITTFLLGIAFTLLISATTVSIMTVKPAQPKSIVVETLNRYHVQEFTYKYYKLGYKVSIVTAPNSNGHCFVVMEKY